MSSDAVIEAAGGEVVVLGQPVHAHGLPGAGVGTDGFDQGAADAGGAGGGIDIQVLQVTYRAKGPAALVIEEMGEADELAIVPGRKGVQNLAGLKAGPSMVLELGRYDRVIKTEIGMPKLGPAGAIGFSEAPDLQRQSGSPPSGP